MDNNKQKETIKKMRTAAKFFKIGKTMLENIKNDIAEDDSNSKLVPTISLYLKPVNLITESIDTMVIEMFKTEQGMPGCQFTLDFGE